MANILVLNAGSGSQKVALYAIHANSRAASAPVWEAAINSTTPGQPEGYFVARERVCDAFGFLDLRLNPTLNISSPADTDIAATDSAVRVLIIKGQENWQIAAESFQAWSAADPTQTPKSR
jgi:acetate kinase